MSTTDNTLSVSGDVPTGITPHEAIVLAHHHLGGAIASTDPDEITQALSRALFLAGYAYRDVSAFDGRLLTLQATIVSQLERGQEPDPEALLRTLWGPGQLDGHARAEAIDLIARTIACLKGEGK